MKTLRFTKFILVLAVTFAVISCKKDETNEVVDSRDSFVGAWNVSDHQVAKANYQVRIYKDENNSDKVWLINFHGTSDTAFAYISNKEITVSPQEMRTTHLQTGGSGLMTGTTKIDFEYYISDGAQQDTIDAVYQK